MKPPLRNHNLDVQMKVTCDATMARVRSPHPRVLSEVPAQSILDGVPREIDEKKAR